MVAKSIKSHRFFDLSMNVKSIFPIQNLNKRAIACCDPFDFRYKWPILAFDLNSNHINFERKSFGRLYLHLRRHFDNPQIQDKKKETLPFAANVEEFSHTVGIWHECIEEFYIFHCS